ncbi:ribonuclease P protein component [bacterium]|nr:MAG: ribonuclease P protein component [bacterium]
MLPKLNRLASSIEISRVYKRGRRAKSANLSLFYFFSGQKIPSRFAFVVSKKQISRIVDRNRLKRILRSGVAGFRSRISPGYSVIVQGQPNMRRLESKKLVEELEDLLKKARIL